MRFNEILIFRLNFPPAIYWVKVKAILKCTIKVLYKSTLLMDTLYTDHFFFFFLKSNYQTHSSVARKKTNKKTSKIKLISKTGNGWKTAVFAKNFNSDIWLVLAWLTTQLNSFSRTDFYWVFNVNVFAWYTVTLSFFLLNLFFF